MEGGRGSKWFDMIVDEIESAIVKTNETIQKANVTIQKVNETIQKKIEVIGAINVKELWSEFIQEMRDQPNREAARGPNIFRPDEHSSKHDETVTEIKETSKTSGSMVQVKKENLGYQASESDVDGSAKLNEESTAMKYINAWFLIHTEEDCIKFVTAVASTLRSKERPDLAAEVEKLLVGPFHVDMLTEALAKYGRSDSNSVEGGEPTDIDFFGGEQVLHHNGNRSEEFIKAMKEDDGDAEDTPFSSSDESVFYKDASDYSEREKEIIEKWKKQVVLRVFGEDQPVDEDSDNSSEETVYGTSDEDETSADKDSDDLSEETVCGTSDKDETSAGEDSVDATEDDETFEEFISDKYETLDEAILFTVGEEEEVVRLRRIMDEENMKPFKKEDEDVGNALSSKKRISYEVLEQDDESSDDDMGLSFGSEGDEYTDWRRVMQSRLKKRDGYVHWIQNYQDESSDEDMGGVILVKEEDVAKEEERDGSNAVAVAAAGANDAAEEEGRSGLNTAAGANDAAEGEGSESEWELV